MTCDALRIFVAACVCATVAATAAAEDAGTPEAAEPTAAEAQAESPDASEAAAPDADFRVRELMQAWMASSPLALDLAQRADVLMVQGVGQAGLSASDERWGKSRALAYEGAYLDALGKFVELKRATVSSSTVRDYFQEDVPESELEYQVAELPEAYLARIAGKAAVLTERNLDQALRDSGMTDDEIQALLPDQKHVTFAERYARSTLVVAVGSASGLVPLKTFEAVDTQGFTAVGVVAAFSQRMHAIADRIARGKAMRADPARRDAPIAAQIEAFADSELPREFGVRVLEDDQGYPVIVSFGQWALRETEGDSNRTRARRREFAFRQAENTARSYLATFIKASTRFSSESTVAEDAEEAISISADGIGEDTDVTTITDRLVETALVRSEVSLTGLTTLRTWQAGHPDVPGHQLVGAVVYWSPAREDAVRTSVGERPKHAVEPATAAPSQPSESGSRVIMDESDF